MIRPPLLACLLVLVSARLGDRADDEAPRVDVRNSRLRRLLEGAKPQEVMLRVGSVALQPGENNIETSESDTAHLFVVTSDSPGGVVKIRKDGLIRVGFLRLNAG